MNESIFQNFPKIWAKISCSNLRKFWKNRVILLKIWIKIGPIWYMDGSLFLENLVYAWVHFQIPSGTYLPKLNQSTPQELCTSLVGSDVNAYYCGCWLKKKKKKKASDFKCTMPPDFGIPCGLSTLYRCSLTTVTQDKLYYEKPLLRDCCNHKGSCTLVRPYLTIAAGISSSSFVWLSTWQLVVQHLVWLKFCRLCCFN